MGLMLIGLMCALSFIALQSTKNKELQKKIDNKDVKSNMLNPSIMNQPKSELLR